jgi:spore coat protein U-like protein
MMRKLVFVLLIPAFIIFVAGNAQADTKTTDLVIMADVNVTCILGGSTINLGTYTGDAISVVGTVGVQCTAGTIYTLSFGEGLYFGLIEGSGRNMYSEEMEPPSYLPYSLMCTDFPGQEADFANECGNGTTIGTVVPVGGYTSTGTPESWQVEAQVAGGFYVPAGHYSDTVVITLDFTPPTP